MTTCVPPAVLAFGFANPWILGGLVLAAIPVIIHLLDRRQFRETSWAAMRFLLAATQRHARRLRLEQLVLLAVRTSIPVLVVLALARPYFEDPEGSVSEGAPRHVILVLDTSLSMGLASGGSTAFERAIETAVSRVEQARSGDRFSLLRIGGSESGAIVLEPTASRAAVLDELTRVRQGEGRGNVAAALAAVLQLPSANVDGGRNDVVLISDFQREHWVPSDTADRLALAELLAEVSEEARVVCLHVGTGEDENRAIVGIEAAESLVLVDQSARLRVRIHNYSGDAMEQVPVELLMDGRLSEIRPIDCEAWSACDLEFQQLFPTSGEYEVEVRIPADGLPLDDRRLLVLPVRDQLSVLLVDGGRRGQLGESAVKYARIALDPSTSRIESFGAVRTAVVSEAELESVDLSLYDAILLCNVPALSEREAEQLEAYVSQGGGVIVSLGDQVDLENYNRLLYRDGAGLLPARLGQHRELDEDSTGAFRFDVGRYEHPALEAFRGNPDTGLETALTFEYIEAALSGETRARVALRFTDTGDPAVISLPFGLGRSVLVTTALDESWGSWPVLSASFVPMLHELVQYVASGRWDERQLLVGEPIRRVFSSEVLNVPAEMRRPDGRGTPLPVKREQSTFAVHFANTSASGIYELILGSPVSLTPRFAVNVDPRESDPAQLDREAMASELFGEAEFVYRGYRQPIADEDDGYASAPRLLSRKLLLLGICLLLVEQLMAWRFAYGLAALGVLLAATLGAWWLGG